VGADEHHRKGGYQALRRARERQWRGVRRRAGPWHPAAREEGKLVVLESGPEEARPRLVPVFDAIGQRTIRAGEAGTGTRLKLVANSWVLAVVEATAETIALAEGLDLDPGLFFEAIDGGTLDLPYLRMKGKAITERDFTPAFRLALAAKDAAWYAVPRKSVTWTCRSSRRSRGASPRRPRSTATRTSAPRTW
jgi:hypothetical protein